jgi:hypothetical protein
MNLLMDSWNRLFAVWDRIREFWSRPAVADGRRRLARGAARGLRRLLVGVVRTLLLRIRLTWAGLSRRSRMVVAIVSLMLISAWSGSIAVIGATAQGLAVLLLAGAGIWMILKSPFGPYGL